VAAHLEPEILLVDEVLAVGDAEFQKKCLGKMGDVAGQGRTVLFVSHNMGAIINLCLTSIMLQRGMLSFKGTSNQAISYYTSGRKATTHDNLEQIVNRKGNGIAKFTYIFLEDETGKKVSQAISGSPITIVLGYKSKKNQINNCRISIAFYNSSGQALFNCSSELTSKNSINLPAEGIIRCRIPKLPLTQSQYTIIPFLESNKEILDLVINGVNFDVIDGDYYGTGRLYPDGWQGKGVLVDQNWSFT
jgi:lipopolysaccharide transport system ATP-binding protein